MSPVGALLGGGGSGVGGLGPYRSSSSSEFGDRSIVQKMDICGRKRLWPTDTIGPSEGIQSPPPPLLLFPFFAYNRTEQATRKKAKTKGAEKKSN